VPVSRGRQRICQANWDFSEKALGPRRQQGGRQVINCSLSRISKTLQLAAPLVFTSMVTASCSLWPSITVNYDGLGESIIGRFLMEKVPWNVEKEDDIARGIKSILANSISKGGDVRSAVESTGMRCDSVPSTTCNYIGNVVFWLHGLPKNSPHRNKKTIVTIYVKLQSYAELSSLIVRKEEAETTAE
jgi:translation elongation factor EF-1beta